MDYPNYEVILADDSTDETIDIIKQWENHPRVKISRRLSRDGYKGETLREALKITESRAEFVLIFDADFIHILIPSHNSLNTSNTQQEHLILAESKWQRAKRSYKLHHPML